MTAAERRARLLAFALAVAAVMLPLDMLLKIALGLHGYDYLGDFRVFWDAGHDVLAGRSPYPPADPALLAQGHSFVYPAPAAFLLAPLSLLPFTVAAMLWTVVSALAIPLSLRVVGVRDWRCGAAALLAFWSGNALANGALTPLLALGLAGLWAKRDRVVAAATLLAALVVAKLFLAPLSVWMVVTRRVRAVVLAAGLCAVAGLGSAAVLGLGSLTGYPHLLGTLSGAEQRLSYSLLSLALGAGLAPTAAHFVVALATGLLGLACWRSRGTDERSFVWIVCALLVLSPIVWPHYFVLLVPVLGILRPRFGGVWLLPFASWLAIHPHSTGAIETAVALAIAGAAVVVAARVASARLIVPEQATARR